MKILISNISNIPLYQQIKDQLKDIIFKGEMVEGDPLPSIRNFATDLKVSVLTIRRVYNELEQELIKTAKTLKISKEELNAMMDILYEEDEQ